MALTLLGWSLGALVIIYHPFDGGSFARTVVEGDIHQELADIYGTTRKAGKGVTYCLIYGGGDMKLGLTAGASKRHAAAKGKEIRKRIMEGLDGLLISHQQSRREPREMCLRVLTVGQSDCKASGTLP